MLARIWSASLVQAKGCGGRSKSCQPAVSWASASSRSTPRQGFLTGSINTATEFTEGDILATVAWFTADKGAANQALVEHIAQLAHSKIVTPGQIVLAWLLVQHRLIVPTPGTGRSERLEENAGATWAALSADELADLDATAAQIGVLGNRYSDLHVGLVTGLDRHQARTWTSWHR
jgi:hypothetical protein